jgi:hypothetical protein
MDVDVDMDMDHPRLPIRRDLATDGRNTSILARTLPIIVPFQRHGDGAVTSMHAIYAGTVHILGVDWCFVCARSGKSG